MRKLVSYTLALALVVTLGTAQPAAAQSQNLSEEEARALIASLMAQISELTALLEEKQSGTSFDHVLSLGSRDEQTNNEVSRLQELLVAEDVYPEAIVSGYFGQLTGNAVVRLKAKYGIAPATMIFDQSVVESINTIKNPPVTMTSLEFFNEIWDNYSSNYGYRETTFDTITIEYPEYESAFSYITETDYEFVNGEGSIGEMMIMELLQNSDGAFGFESLYDVISIENEDVDYVFTKLTNYEEENPFKTEEELEGMGDILDEWLRTDSSEIVSGTLITSLEPEIFLELIETGAHEIDFENKYKNLDWSNEFEVDIYTYPVTIDTAATGELFEEHELMETLVDEIKSFTEFDTYAEAIDGVTDMSLDLHVHDDRLFGISTSYTMEYVDNEGDDSILTRQTDWVTHYELFTGSVEIEAPREYTNIN